MSVPQGFYELRTAPDNPDWPVFLRVVPLRESVEYGYCDPSSSLPCGREQWLRRRPASVLYVGPIARWQVPMARAITRVAVDRSWPLAPLCPTWGAAGGACRQDRWVLPDEVVPIVPSDLFPWPYSQATWTVIKESTPPLAHEIVAGAPPQLFKLRPLEAVAMR